MVVHLTSSKVGSGLWYKFCTHHRLTIPVRGRVDGGLETSGFTGDGRVLVGCIGVEVCRGSTRAMDVPLVCSDLVRP